MPEHARAILIGALVVLALAPSAQAQHEPRITIGSKSFTESRILAELMAQLIEQRTGLDVARRPNLGGTLIAHRALTSGAIDLYPEYTGTAWAAVLERTDKATDPLRTFLEVDRSYRERYGLLWLAPFGFNNSYAVAIREDTAERLGITRISDLAAHAGNLRSAWSHEFLNRQDGLPGLAAAYGIDLAEVRGMEHGLAYEAIRTGQIDVTDAYTTDGKLLRFPIRVLEDDRRYFPPYDAAPVVRADLLERHPAVGEALAELAYILDDHSMQALNFRVEEEGLSHAAAAGAFLAERGLLAPRSDREAAPSRKAVGPLRFLLARAGETARLVGEHLSLSTLGVLLAIALAVPLGIVLTRRPRLASPVLQWVGVLQTIPSLALLAFMIPLLGLGAPAAVVALFLYALLPILRNTVTGIRGVDPLLVDAARGMGLTRGQILRRIELPLAIRTIMAGVRTAAVISIGVATLAAFIGAGGLGDPIVTGLQLNDSNLILAGAIPAALLAILTDAALALLERKLTPRGLR